MSNLFEKLFESRAQIIKAHLWDLLFLFQVAATVILVSRQGPWPEFFVAVSHALPSLRIDSAPPMRP
jgi:hypothetical protein